MPLAGKKLGGNRLVLGAGFFTILLLMTLLTLHGLGEMEAITAQLQRVVNEYNVKAALIKQMRMSARERVFTIQHMLLINDPFEQDEEALTIDDYGAQFTRSRRELLSLPLNRHERFLIDQQGALAQQAVPLQREAINLIIGGNKERARQILIHQVIPLQQRVLAALSQLEAQQELAIEQIVREAVVRQQRARAQIIVLGGIATALGVLIALLTIRHNYRTESNLHREKERAQITLHSIGDGVITASAGGIIEYLNPAAAELTGWRSEAARDRPLLEVLRLVGDDLTTPRFATVGELLAQDEGEETLTQSRLLAGDGTALAIEYTAAAIHNRDGAIGGVVVTLRDASEFHALTATLSHQARHDPLTNLINRREFEHRLEQALLRARQEGLQHALCFLDLDRFKVVNDSCGHAAGDELLKQLVARLKGLVRGNDLLARLGGDEFGLLLENCPQEKARTIAEEIRNAVSSFVFVWEKQSFRIGVSIGMVMVGPDAGSLSEVIAMADSACYTAKDSGRNRVHLYASELGDRQQNDKQPWSQRLQQALLDDRFSLYCQSIVAINPAKKSRHLCELQLRFRDEQGQQILPMAFIPAAERHNLMPAIDRWVMRHASQLIALIENPDAIYCLNLSPQTVADPQFLPALRQQLAQQNISPGQICLEITESHALANQYRTGEFLRELREIGCLSALDDVGHSIGSYDYLKALPVDFIKIDGHLIGSLQNSTISAVQVKAITQIAHLLGICVIAEMVEDHTTLKRLAGLGINYAQGFGIAKPRPVAELKAVLAAAATGAVELGRA